MKLLWLCNSAPGVVKSHITGKNTGAVNWVDHVLADLRRQGLTIRVLCPGNSEAGMLDEACGYATFPIGKPWIYSEETEAFFSRQIRDFQPDVIHCWGTEYAHTHAMANAAEKAGKLDNVVASIQGLCSVIATHYAEGIPPKVQRGLTFRDLVRQDNILQQQKKFVLRGQQEVAALKKLRHILGRTHWDRACTFQINPQAAYHSCNETLREAFYQEHWHYERCRKHSVFASSCVYPVKGFHYLLEAVAMVSREYPDVTISVPGQSYLTVSPLRRSAYQKYLADLTKRYGMENRITFLGKCTAEQMKAAYLEANAFVLPSTVENSPNSLGEAMLLGVPCVSADVGGVKNLLTHEAEGFLYQSTAPYMLAYHIRQIFAMEEKAAAMGQKARAHALHTHDPQQNLSDLLAIYEAIR